MIQFRCNNCLNLETFGNIENSTQKSKIKHFNPKESIIIFENEKLLNNDIIQFDDIEIKYDLKDIISCKKNINYIIKSLNDENNISTEDINLKNLIFCNKCCKKIINLLKEDITYQRYILKEYNRFCKLEENKIDNYIELEIKNKEINNDILKITEKLNKLIKNNKHLKEELDKLKLQYDNELKLNIKNDCDYNNTKFYIDEYIDHNLNMIKNHEDHINKLKYYNNELINTKYNYGLFININFNDFKEENKYKFEKIKDYIIKIENNEIYYNNICEKDINFLLGEYCSIIHLIISINKLKINYKVRAIGNKSYIINKIYDKKYPLYFNNSISIDELNSGIKTFRQCINDIYNYPILNKNKPLYKMYDDKIIYKNNKVLDLILKNDNNLTFENIDINKLNKWLFALKLLGKNIIGIGDFS
jgi:hypothetical protein